MFVPLYKLFITYGKIFRLSFGPKSFVVISDPAYTKQARWACVPYGTVPYCQHAMLCVIIMDPAYILTQGLASHGMCMCMQAAWRLCSGCC